MNAAEQLRARAARVREAAAPAPAAEPEPRPEPVGRRQSVDLPGQTHADFVRWRLEAGLQLERPVSMNDAIEGAVTVMLTDPRFGRAVRDWLSTR